MGTGWGLNASNGPGKTLPLPQTWTLFLASQRVVAALMQSNAKSVCKHFKKEMQGDAYLSFPELTMLHCPYLPFVTSANTDMKRLNIRLKANIYSLLQDL